jgi:hypothetical protein
LADKSAPIVLDALRRALAEPAGLPLHGTRSERALFANSAAGKRAAEECRANGYLRVLRTETNGKTRELCGITDQGVAYLLAQVSPRGVLEDLLRAVEGREAQLDRLVAVAGQTHNELAGLKALAERALREPARPAREEIAELSDNGAAGWQKAVLAHLRERHVAQPANDCPLPELYRRAQGAQPGVTIGQFHDGLRGLHERGHIYLHPWTGPLYELPEPACALLVGHEVAYYASPRRPDPE